MNTIGWGQAVNNNSIGWGTCAKNNILNFALIYGYSYSVETVLA